MREHGIDRSVQPAATAGPVQSGGRDSGERQGAHQAAARRNARPHHGDRRARTSLSKGTGFIPLTQARQIPVGSVLDATGGTVAIKAASNAKGAFYTGMFAGGIFKLLQNRPQKSLTDLTLMDVLSRNKVCVSVGKRASTAKHLSNAVLGLLKASDNGGRFSTRGAYSATTVRGTAYSVQDTCAGTLTEVTRGSVVVDYLRRHKLVVVTAGHAFLAKATGGPSAVTTIGKRASELMRAARLS